MSRSDARTLLRLNDRAQAVEAARFEQSVTGLGFSVDKFTGAAFREWMRTADPSEIVPALQQVARQPTPALKRLKAAKIADVWE
jgi:hypothetical protein